MLYTTFKLLREQGACQADYDKFAGIKGGVEQYGDDTPIPLDEIVEAMGLADSLWALRALTAPIPSWVYLMLAEYAERVLPIFERWHPEDERPRKAIQAVRDFVAGKITKDQLKVFVSTAYSAYASAGGGAFAVDAAYSAYASAAFASACSAYASAYPAYASVVAIASASAASFYAVDASTSAVAASFYTAEIKWHTKRFLELLRKGGIGN